MIAKPVQVYARHCRGTGLCLRGARVWVEAHGMDWRSFVKEGVPSDDPRVQNDAFAARVIAIARAEQEKNNGLI